MASLLGGCRARDHPELRQRLRSARHMVLAWVRLMDFNLSTWSAGDLFSSHPEDDFISVQRIWLLKSCLESCFISFFFFLLPLKAGGCYFILQFFIYLVGKEAEVAFLEIADLMHSPQPALMLFPTFTEICFK